MQLKRCIRKRRSLLKYISFFGMMAFLLSVWKLFSELNPSFEEFRGLESIFSTVRYSPYATNVSREMASKYSCQKQGHFEIKYHADVYTYDLPDITDYTLITGKRFKEYNIPVKSEAVAYGPDLDPVTVLLIPFSHVDPGYGRTMEQYYKSLTKHTLDNMVNKLEQYEDLTFQWAETVFLERWWRDITPDVKDRIRKLIRRGKLEIVLGGWVMPDEASTHYVSVIDQLLEGHQWVIENLHAKPRNSWSNDPFGFSSTMPYLWKKSGIDNMVILRIHQAIKGTLMKRQTMEFTWKQLWSDDEANSILCHLMPYRGYWIGDTCGPYNQHICREYAFMHTEPIHKVVFITKENLEERARILYEQYRITSEIYRRHGLDEKKPGVRLFVPIFLGEDFSYTSASDFDLIYTNYKTLFDYINSKEEWRMIVKFGTLNEYFALIRNFQILRNGIDKSRFPTLAGDFFPYSDYQNDYWTGYYTTRPFNKQISREIQALIRTADIFHSYAFAYSRSQNIEYSNFEQVSASLRDARRDLGMFLHHDGITGTSVLSVIQDFQERLYNSLTKAKHAIKVITGQLLNNDNAIAAADLSDVSKRFSKLAINTLVPMAGSSVKLLVLNPSARTRNEIISILTTSPVKVVTSSYNRTITQLDEIDGKFLASIRVKTLPFSIQTYTVETTTQENIDEQMFSSKEMANENGHTITIENKYIRAEFDRNSGLLSSLTDLSSFETWVSFQTDILAYTSGRSGAYIFAPAGNAVIFLKGTPTITVTRGVLMSKVVVTYKGYTFVATLYNIESAQGKGLHITTSLDMKNIDCNNKEAVLRFKTDIRSENHFFTDQNGFQLMGRKTYTQRAIEQNYYPATTMVMIEDETRRLTLHMAQPHGVASLESGWLEVMLDRCVSRDDDKGLGQGVNDNVQTEAMFVLQLETFRNTVETKENRYTFPSENAVELSEITEQPLYTLFLKDPGTTDETKKWESTFLPMHVSLPCSLMVVGLRTLVKDDLSYNGTSLILHRKSAMCMSDKTPSQCEQSGRPVTISTLFPDVRITHFEETSLTHLDVYRELSTEDDISPQEMELRSYKVEF